MTTPSTQDPQCSSDERAGLLPRKWAKVILVVVIVLLGVGYVIGMRARGPAEEPALPVYIYAPPPPEAVPD